MLDVSFHGPVTCSMRRTGNIGDPFNSADSLSHSVEILARRAEWYWYHFRFIVCLLRKWSSTSAWTSCCCLCLEPRSDWDANLQGVISKSESRNHHSNILYLHNKMAHIWSSTRLRKKGIAPVTRKQLAIALHHQDHDALCPVESWHVTEPTG